MLKRKAFLAVLTIMVLVLAACFQVATAPEQTKVNFYLTDKPTVEAEHLYIAIDSVSYQIAGEEGGFTTVSTDSTVVDLLELAGDLLALGDADVEGTLTKIRLEVSAATVVTDEGTYGCDVPSDKIDVIVPEYEFAKELDVLIDFEAGASLHIVKTGGPSPSYKLRPVVKASIMVPEERIEISGIVQDSSGTGLAGYIVALFETEEPSTDSGNILAMTVSHRGGGRWNAGDFRFLTTADDATHAVAVLDAETVEEGTSTVLMINAILDSIAVVLDSDKDGIVLTVPE